MTGILLELRIVPSFVAFECLLFEYWKGLRPRDAQESRKAICNFEIRLQTVE